MENQRVLHYLQLVLRLAAAFSLLLAFPGYARDYCLATHGNGPNPSKRRLLWRTIRRMNDTRVSPGDREDFKKSLVSGMRMADVRGAFDDEGTTW